VSYGSRSRLIDEINIYLLTSQLETLDVHDMYTNAFLHEQNNNLHKSVQTAFSEHPGFVLELLEEGTRSKEVMGYLHRSFGVVF
jgi:hypothetical protein